VTFLAVTASGLYAADDQSLVYYTRQPSGAWTWSYLLGETTDVSNGLLAVRFAADAEYVYSSQESLIESPWFGGAVEGRSTITITRWRGATGEEIPGGVSGPYKWSLIVKYGWWLMDQPHVYGLLADDVGLYVHGAFDMAGNKPAAGWAYWDNQAGGWQVNLLPPPERKAETGATELYSEWRKTTLYNGNDMLVAPVSQQDEKYRYLFAPSLWEAHDGDWRELAFPGGFLGPIASVGCDIYAYVRYASPPWPSPISGLARLARTCRAGGAVHTTRGVPVGGVTVNAGAAQAATADDGSYTLTDLPAGPITLAPSQPGFAFDPSTRALTFPLVRDDEDFVLLPAPVSVALRPGETTRLTYTDVSGLPVTLDVPPGATGATGITLAAAVPPGLSALQVATGHAFELRVEPPDEGSFARRLTLTIAYTDGEVRLLRNEAQLTLYRWNSEVWVENSAVCPGDTRHDVSANRFSTAICAPGRYMLAGPARGVSLPYVAR
jgi:hypothetical protein